ncbi:uncharacterized protein LOC134253047, partial [Saccostrea cucullata]|uniref:uncharacterized protein LOC134253047 n=1 Tax=Saccostrea cuccullata TaxID=36930 RepID=UPI002ED295A9
MRLDHKMIPDFFKKDVGPLEAVRNHFEELMEGERIWNWLPYIVCVGYHDKTEIRQEIASAFDIPKSTLSNCKNINEYTKTVDKNELAPMWSHKKNLVKTEDNKREGNVIVFWHNFLYICAFHACYKKYPQKIMRHCNLDAILQLVRPKNQSEALTIEASNEEVDLFCEERLSKFGNDSLFLEHPLFQDGQNGKEKYTEHLELSELNWQRTNAYVTAN